jgi:hypothetical protein
LFFNDRKKFTSEYNKISNELRNSILLCEKQNQEIVRKPIKELDKLSGKDEDVEFTKDESNALFYIDRFDLSKLTTLQEYRYLDLIIKNCNEKNLEIYFKLEEKRDKCINHLVSLSLLREMVEYDLIHNKYKKEVLTLVRKEELKADDFKKEFKGNEQSLSSIIVGN